MWPLDCSVVHCIEFLAVVNYLSAKGVTAKMQISWILILDGGAFISNWIGCCGQLAENVYTCS